MSIATSTVIVHVVPPPDTATSVTIEAGVVIAPVAAITNCIDEPISISQHVVLFTVKENTLPGPPVTPTFSTKKFVKSSGINAR